MQKFFIVTTLLFMGVSGYLGYKLYTSHDVDTKIKATVPDMCRSLNYDYKGVDFEGIVNYSTAKALYDYYNENNNTGRLIFPTLDGSVTPSNDSRSVWFPLERLKCFIWNIEKENCSNQCKHDLGLRVYFGRYPKPSDTLWSKGYLDGVPPVFANRHTVFMIPTYYDDTKKTDVDFYPADKSCTKTLEDWARIPLDSGEVFINQYKPNKIPFIFLAGTVTAPDTGDGQNHGTLIPPNNPEGTSFLMHL